MWKLLKTLDHMLNIVPLRVPDKLVCIILWHVMNSMKVGKVYLRVISWTIMHGCVGYIVRELVGYPHLWKIHFGLQW